MTYLAFTVAKLYSKKAFVCGAVPLKTVLKAAVSVVVVETRIWKLRILALEASPPVADGLMRTLLIVCVPPARATVTNWFATWPPAAAQPYSVLPSISLLAAHVSLESWDEKPASWAPL